MRCAGKEEAQWLDGLVRCLELSVAITLTTFNQKFIYSARILRCTRQLSPKAKDLIRQNERYGASA